MSPPAGNGSSKEELRRLFRRRRRQCLAAAAPGILATAERHLGALLVQRPGRLGLYWPLGSEPDLRPPGPGLGRPAGPAGGGRA